MLLLSLLFKLLLLLSMLFRILLLLLLLSSLLLLLLLMLLLQCLLLIPAPAAVPAYATTEGLAVTSEGLTTALSAPPLLLCLVLILL